ncbi:MAG: ComEC/Rec2 family competence protein [bacterium]
MHKSQLFFILLCCFVAGVALGSFLAFEQYILYLFFIPPIVIIGIFWRKNWKIVFVALATAFLLFGTLRIFNYRLSNTFINRFGNSSYSVTMTGYMDSESKPKENSRQFVFRVKELQVSGFTIPEKLNEKILVIVEPYPAYQYGDKLSVKGKISLPESFNDFDYISYLAKDQIHTLTIYPEISSSRLNLGFFESLKVKLFAGIFKFKAKFEGAIGLAVKEPHASFLSGILLGSRQNIPDDLKNDFATTSLTHILAISGYNIVIVSAAVFWVLLFFFRRNVAFWFALLAIFLFTILTGASASVVRSALMGGLILMATSSGRLYDSKNALALVAFLMVLANPMILRFDIGFQLSFLATLGILYVSPILGKFFAKSPNTFGFKETFLMTVSAQIMVLPLILFYFHNLSLVSIPANLLVLPLVPLGMLTGFLTGIAGMLWSNLGLLIGALAWLVVSVEIFLVRFFARLPYSSLTIFMSWQWMVGLYVIILGALYRLNKRFKEN